MADEKPTWKDVEKPEDLDLLDKNEQVKRRRIRRIIATVFITMAVLGCVLVLIVVNQPAPTVPIEQLALTEQYGKEVSEIISSTQLKFSKSRIQEADGWG